MKNDLRNSLNIYPVHWYENFLVEDEINKLVNYSERLRVVKSRVGDLQSKINNLYIEKLNKKQNYRKSSLKWISRNLETEWIFEKIINQIFIVNNENYNFILTHLDDLQLTEYDDVVNGFYEKHYDCGIKNKKDYIRKLSFTIQLSDLEEYEGGDLVFYFENEQKKIAPKSKGTIIFFQSDILHEVTPVKKGKRLSLVSWVSGPNIR